MDLVLPDMDEVSASETISSAYGLRKQVLSPMETLAQSISAIAPSTSAALTVPLVFALAGAGTCVAYLVAMTGMMLVALCIVTFAKDSASPGSLYVYARDTLPPKWAAVTGWSLVFAYIMTAASVIGGFTSFAYVLLGRFGGHFAPGLVAAVAAICATAVAYKDIQISARMMLYIEGISVFLIVLVVGLTLWKHGLHFDSGQFRLRGMTPSGVRLGIILAVFSFVGFESATSLGAEARNPLQSIPRAVIWSTLLSGLFFVGCAYGEVLGFAGASTSLSDSTAPMRELAARAGVGYLGPIIDVGVCVSMFAATLAFVIAIARLLMLMAHDGLVSRVLGRTDERHHTPALAGLLGGVLAYIPAGWLVQRGASGAEVYGWMGSLAVFGYLLAYALVALASVLHQRQRNRVRPRTIVLAAAATLAMIGVAIGTLVPVPPSPYRYFPLLFGAFLVAALLWHLRPDRSDA